MLSPDTSSQNSRTIKTATSFTQLASSNISPRFNKQQVPQSATSIKSKPQDRLSNPSSATKKSGAQTPVKYQAATNSKGSLSPISAHKSQSAKKDFSSELSRKLEKSNTISINKTVTNKPVISVKAASSSSLMAGYHVPDLNRRVSDNKFDHSIEIHNNSISEATDFHDRDEQKSDQQLTPQMTYLRPVGSDLDLLSGKSGKLNLDTPGSGQASKKNKNDNNTVLLMQNVYSIKAKPLNLANALRSVSRPKNHEDDANKSKTTVSSNNLGDGRRVNGQNYQSVQNNISVRKRGNETVEQIKDTSNLDIKKVNSASGWSIVTSMAPVESRTTTLESNLESYRKPMLQSSSTKDLIRTDSPLNRRFKGAMNNRSKLEQQLVVFAVKLNGVINGVHMKEKRSFFIKLLQILHKQKVLLSQFYQIQDYNKMASHFHAWREYIKNPKRKLQVDDLDDDEDELNLLTAINFYNQKVYSKYFYQGFLGHYALCKLGPVQEKPVSPKVSSPKKTPQKIAPAGSFLQPPPPRKAPLDTGLKSPIRSKTPVQSRSKQPAPIKEINTTKATPIERSPYGNSSPNQSFTASFEKSIKKEAPRSGPKSPIKTPQRVRNLNKSFEQKVVKPISAKCVSGGETPVTPAVTWQSTTQVTKSVGETDSLAPKKVKSIGQITKNKGYRDTPNDGALDSSRSMYSDKGGKSATFVSPRKADIAQNKSINTGNGQTKSIRMPEKKVQDRTEVSKVIKKRTETKKDTISFQEIKISQGNNSTPLKQRESLANKSSPKNEAASDESDLLEEIDEIDIRRARVAEEFNNKRLIKTYGQLFITTLIEEINRKLEAAWYMRIRNLLKRGFLGLCTGRLDDNSSFFEEVDQEEKDSELMQKMMKVAQEHYETNRKINVFNAIMENYIASHEENERYAQHRERYLLKTCFKNWSQIAPEPKEEDYGGIEEVSEESDEESAYDAIVEQFRFIMLAEKAMRQLKANVSQSPRNKLAKKRLV